MNTFLILFGLALIMILFNESKNFTTSLLTFVLISILIAFGSGVYSWYIKIEQVDSLTHVHSLEWSEHYSFPGYTSDRSASFIDDQDQLHRYWINYDSLMGRVELKQMTINPLGEMSSYPKVIFKIKEIQQLAIDYFEDQVHLFWIGQEKPGVRSLYHTRLNLAGEIIDQQPILQNAFGLREKVTEFKIASTDERFLLVWRSKNEQQNHTTSLLLNHQDQIIRGPESLTDSAMSLNLTADRFNQFHLVWKEQTTPELAHLYYQRFDQQGSALTPPVLVDQGKIAEIGISSTQERLALVWNRETIHNNTQRDVIYGTHFQLNQATPTFKIRQLTEIGSATEPRLATDHENRLFLTYSLDTMNTSSLAYQIFSEELVPVMERPDWILPKVFYSKGSQLLVGSSGKPHLYWYNAVGDHSFQYVNTVNRTEITHLEIIGFPKVNFPKSFWENVIYIFMSPLIDLTIFLIFVLNVMGLLLSTVIMNFVNKVLTKSWNNRILHKNLYVSTTLICGLHLLFSYLIFQNLRHPMLIFQIKEHYLFILSIGFLGNLVYIALNRMGDSELMFGGYIGIAWLYWMALTINIMNLPFANYVYLPHI